MAIVLVLFLFGAANSASISLNPQFAPGPVQHLTSNVPSAEYMSLENLLGSTITYTHGQTAVPLSDHINAAIEEVVIVPSVRNADPEPYLVSGPVAEYVVPFDIPGVQFTGEGLLQPASVPVETAPVPEVVQYSILPEAKPVIDNYYKVDDGQLETVNPTYVTYDSFGSASVNLDPVTPLFDTFVKVDDGQLKQFNLLHISNSVQNLVPLYDQTPVVDTYVAPTLTDISEVKFDNNPILAISNMLKSFHKQDNGNLEEITPKHVVYSIPKQIDTPVTLRNKVPVSKISHTSDDVITYSSTVVAPEPTVKTKAKLQPKSSTNKVEETNTDAEVSERAEASEGSEGSEAEETGEGDHDAEAKSEGEEKSVDEDEDEEEEVNEYSQATKKEDDSDED